MPRSAAPDFPRPPAAARRRNELSLLVIEANLNSGPGNAPTAESSDLLRRAREATLCAKASATTNVERPTRPAQSTSPIGRSNKLSILNERSACGGQGRAGHASGRCECREVAYPGLGRCYFRRM